MAPSLTETVALRAPPVAISLKSDGGHNKENLIGYKCEKDVEIKGTDKVPPVSYPEYLPVWDNETERYSYTPVQMPNHIPMDVISNERLDTLLWSTLSTTITARMPTPLSRIYCLRAKSRSTRSLPSLALRSMACN
jgi:hypothetical protein